MTSNSITYGYYRTDGAEWDVFQSYHPIINSDSVSEYSHSTFGNEQLGGITIGSDTFVYDDYYGAGYVSTSDADTDFPLPGGVELIVVTTASS